MNHKDSNRDITKDRKFFGFKFVSTWYEERLTNISKKN